jgi:hypothetical protein
VRPMNDCRYRSGSGGGKNRTFSCCIRSNCASCLGDNTAARVRGSHWFVFKQMLIRKPFRKCYGRK